MNPHSTFSRAGAALVGALLGALLLAPAAQAQSRGELLYSTHCITCHTAEVHWRDKKVATNWASLTFQVRRWQDASGLGWSDSDIQEVARYLNESIYRYPPMADSVTRLGASLPTRAAAPIAEAKGR